MQLLPKIFTCQACGALAPHLRGPRLRVSTFNFVCDEACRRRYLENLAGLSDTDVSLMYAGSLPGTVEISREDMPAGAERDVGYREHLRMIVEAMGPHDLTGNPYR